MPSTKPTSASVDSNVTINLISDDEDDKIVATIVLSDDDDDEDNPPKPLLKSTSGKPGRSSMAKSTVSASSSKSQNKQKATLPNDQKVCANAGCYKFVFVANAGDELPLCTACRNLSRRKRYISKGKENEATTVKRASSQTPLISNPYDATSSTATVIKRRKPYVPGESSNQGSETAPGTESILPVKESPGILKSPGIPQSSITNRVNEVSSSEVHASQHNSSGNAATKTRVVSVPEKDFLTSLSGKKSGLAFGNPSLISEEGQYHGKAQSLNDKLKLLSLRVEAERVALIRSELQKSISVAIETPKEFTDDVSPFSQVKNIEVPGQDLATALTFAKNTKINSVPFQETRCTLRKIPGFKNFEFIKRNVMASDNKILRFRRFDYSEKISAVQRTIEEKARYDKTIDANTHKEAMKIGEDCAALYKYIPAILQATDCTDEALPEAAKSAFALAFKGFGCSLPTLIECRGERFDIADFVQPEEVSDSGSDHAHDLDVGKKVDESPKALKKDLEPLGTHWLLCCPICQTFQCGKHGEPVGNGDINTDLSFLPHSEQMSRLSKEIGPKMKPCSDECYLLKPNASEDELTPWNDDDERLLQSLAQSTEIPACLLRTTLGKECYDIHLHQKKVRDHGISTQHHDMPQLSWYDNKKKILNWVDPVEARHSSVDTSIHRHAEMPKIKPCSHDGPCSDTVGGCHEQGLCNKFCLCPSDCHMRFTGCNCTATYGACESFSCPCAALGFECDPELCKSCGAVENADPLHAGEKLDDGSCQNVALQRGTAPRVAIGESTFEGWGYGLFACEDIKTGTFLGEYVGEIVTEAEAERRGIIYEEYFFSLNSEQSIDATRKGNHMRFINGTYPGDKLENARAKTFSVAGEHRIALFSSKFIKAGTEIFMDYGINYEKKHQLHGGGKMMRKENPMKWTLGNHEGQIAIVLDLNSPVPIVQELPVQSASEQTAPARSEAEQSGAEQSTAEQPVLEESVAPRTVKRPLHLKRAHVPDPDDSDDQPVRPSLQSSQVIELEEYLTPSGTIDTNSAAYKALTCGQKHSLSAKHRWKTVGESAFGRGEGSRMEIDEETNKEQSPNRKRLNRRDSDKTPRPKRQALDVEGTPSVSRRLKDRSDSRNQRSHKVDSDDTIQRVLPDRESYNVATRSGMTSSFSTTGSQRDLMNLGSATARVPYMGTAKPSKPPNRVLPTGTARPSLKMNSKQSPRPKPALNVSPPRRRSVAKKTPQVDDRTIPDSMDDDSSSNLARGSNDVESRIPSIYGGDAAADDEAGGEEGDALMAGRPKRKTQPAVWHARYYG